MSYGLFGPLGGMIGVLLGATLGAVSGWVGMLVGCVLLGGVGYMLMALLALSNASDACGGKHLVLCPRRRMRAELGVDSRAAAWALLRGELVRIESCSLCGEPPTCDRCCEEPLTESLDNAWWNASAPPPPEARHREHDIDEPRLHLVVCN